MHTHVIWGSDWNVGYLIVSSERDEDIPLSSAILSWFCFINIRYVTMLKDSSYQKEAAHASGIFQGFIVYKWLHDCLVISLVNFAKGFEMAIIVIAVISFLLFNLFLTIKYLRRLPKYYAIEVVDTYGNKTAVEGLRVLFATYDAAESYARFYQDIYKDQYKFRVSGLKE